LVDISIIGGGFFKRKKSEGRDKCFALGTWVLAKWDLALWRKF
jgi:hypothetical protein